MPSDDLEARVTALEVQVQDLTGQVGATRQDAAAARVLAGAADRDVTEIRDDLRDFRRGTIASFNALRQDMTDGFAEMRAKFDLTAAGQQRIVELIQSVINTQGGTAPACATDCRAVDRVASEIVSRCRLTSSVRASRSPM